MELIYGNNIFCLRLSTCHDILSYPAVREQYKGLICPGKLKIRSHQIGWIRWDKIRSRAERVSTSILNYRAIATAILHNTIIKGFWRHLKEKLGLNLKDFLLRGKTEHLFNPHDPLHEYVHRAFFFSFSNLIISRPLFYWIFAPLIQAELDEFAEWWNNHRVRHQHEKIMPSGHVPAHAMQYPELFGALDCQIKVPQQAVDMLREELTREEGPVSQFQAWPGLTAEFDERASAAYEEIGAPSLTMAKAWDVFVNMAVAMAL
ncbi:hypothetical protein GGX14DRAFT_381829 [Mycena pura]|uniref:Uncharacterized protein n=1 Tax=Mycena pura TaxID=153505 RepID=A0AAD6XYF9_9AGAR|nr:hypothetical protein GGX14DRAFT_381829 [Mycena pura]